LAKSEENPEGRPGACPVCAAPDPAFFQRAGGRDLLVCRACRHVFWAEMPTAAELEAFYRDAYTESHGQAGIQASQRAYYRGHATELAAACGISVDAMAIADIGCSYPVFLEEAAAAGAGIVLGVDWSEEARAAGRATGIAMMTPVEFAAEVPDASLDVLRYAHVLEHLTDPLGALRSDLRKLRPGGLVYVTQPSFPVFRAAETPVALHDCVWPNHLHYFNPVSVAALAEAAGLVVERGFAIGEPREDFRPFLDLPHAEAAGATLRDRGEAIRGAHNNFPLWLGPDGAFFLRKPQPPAGNDTLSRLRRRAGGGERDAGLRAEAAALRKRLAEAEAALAAMRGSASWRVTAPLRRVLRALRGG
jgi:SAM-dependent methyltransferase